MRGNSKDAIITEFNYASARQWAPDSSAPENSTGG